MTKLGRILTELTTKDYQNRGHNYPKPNVPTDIRFDDDMKNKKMTLYFAFKNTNESTAEKFIKSYLNRDNINKKYILNVYQDGDYKDDWVEGTATFKR